MKVYSQLEFAQLHNSSTDLSLTATGLIFWHTGDARAKIHNGTALRALLLNDDKLLIGTSGTAADNIRLNRSAAGVLQLLLGSDTTAEGVRSTTLAQLSSRVENFSNTTRPAAGNYGRIIFNTDEGQLQFDNGLVWAALDTSPVVGTADRVAIYDASGILASSVVTVTELGYLSGVTSNVQTQLDSKATSSDLTNHLADTTDAHDASAISTTAITGVAGGVASDVQAVVADLKAQIDTKAPTTDLNNHLSDTTDAHDASAISYVNTTSGLVATTAQAAIDEVDGNLDTHTAATGAHGVTTVAGLTEAQTFTGVKTFDKELVVKEIATPAAAPAGYARLFVDSSDGVAKKIDDAGVVSPLGGGGGGGSFVWRTWSNAPLEDNVGGMDVLDFAANSEQEIWAHIQVPASYVAGTPIKLVGGLCATSATAGNILFRAVTSLVEPGATVLGTYSNQHTSTNAQLTANAVASTITAIGDIDLTDASGRINLVAVAPGDILLVKLIRDTSAETSSAAADARFLRFSMAPKFTA